MSTKQINLKGRHCLTLKDYTPEEILFLVDRAIELKEKKQRDREANRCGELLIGRNVVLIFDKSSTRTRCAFEIAIADEGGFSTFLTNSQMGKKETIKDTARVLGRYYDAIQYRGSEQRIVEELANHAGIPVYNGLTDLYHPTQVLADLMTIRENIKRELTTVKLVYIGDARFNMANSLIIIAAKTGMNITVIAPEPLQPEQGLVDEMRSLGTAGEIIVTDNTAAVRDADVIYTDVWASMGEEEQLPERIKLLEPYRVDEALMRNTGKTDTIFLHCLPAFHDNKTEIGKLCYDNHGIEAMEVGDAVFESNASLVFDQAENRMHTIKALLVSTIGTSG